MPCRANNECYHAFGNVNDRAIKKHDVIIQRDSARPNTESVIKHSRVQNIVMLFRHELSSMEYLYDG